LRFGHKRKTSHVKVAIGGASGFIGTALVPALEAKGHAVVRLVRHEPLDAAEIRWDPGAGLVDSSSLAGIGALVCLNGATIAQRWTEGRKREILESRTSTTSLLARTAAQLEPQPVLICASAMGAYGDRGDEILTEESERGSGFLADVVRSWEAAADPARAAGVRVVHFRHGHVLSGRGGLLERVLVPFKLGLGGRLGSGKQWWSWIELHDLTSAYGLALSTGLDGVVNLVAPNPVTNAQFAAALGKALRRPAVLPTPTLALKTRFGSEMVEDALLSGQRLLPARLLDAGFEFSAATIDVALERALSA
jgi:uncharacterized protein (TIGR01777 family)